MGKGRRARSKLILVVMALWTRGQHGIGVVFGSLAHDRGINNYQFARIHVVDNIHWYLETKISSC